MSWDPWELDFGNDIQNEVRVDFDEVKAQTDAAVLIRIAQDEYWIPKSQIGEMEKKPGRFASGGWLTIPEWLAEKKDLA